MSPSTAATKCGTPHSRPDSSLSRQTPPGHTHCPLLTSAHCLPTGFPTKLLVWPTYLPTRPFLPVLFWRRSVNLAVTHLIIHLSLSKVQYSCVMWIWALQRFVRTSRVWWDLFLVILATSLLKRPGSHYPTSTLPRLRSHRSLDVLLFQLSNFERTSVDLNITLDVASATNVFALTILCMRLASHHVIY